MSWTLFALVLGLFFVTHSIPVRPQIKHRLHAVLGARGFTICYSLLSVFMLGLVITSAKAAPYVEIWPQAGWHRFVMLAGMFLACLIAAFAIGRPNPFSFGGTRNETYNPARPGIVRLSRHPLLLAMALWAGLHVLLNGDLAHVILFGVFLAFSLLGGRIIDRRKQRQMGAGVWNALRSGTAEARIFAWPTNPADFVGRSAAATGVFAALLFLHQPVIGAYPWPM